MKRVEVITDSALLATAIEQIAERHGAVEYRIHRIRKGVFRLKMGLPEDEIFRLFSKPEAELADEIQPK